MSSTSSTTSSPERIEKVSSDNVVIAFDLLTNLTYMSCMTLAQLPRETILRKAGEQPLKTAIFFEQVYLLAQRLGLEYSNAFQNVAGRARASNVKALLLRFASTISSGESEPEFIQEETRLEARRYVNQYENSIENLKRWTDAYAALLVSVTLIVVVALVSTLTGALQQNFVVLMGFGTFFITGVGVWIILRSSPYEERTYTSGTGIPPDRRMSILLLKTVGPVGIILALVLGYLFGIGAGLTALGLALLPAGYFASRDDKKVSALDKEISTFIRTLGATAGARQTTLGMALPDLDTKSMGSLGPHIERLKIRIAAQIAPDICWEQFSTETGNELVRRSTRMLVESVESGADATQAGDVAATYASAVSEMRDIRKLTASSFTFLALPMHAAMTGLLMFILAIVTTFTNKLQEVAGQVAEGAVEGISGAGIDLFAAQDMGVATGVVTFVIITLTVANALAPKFAAGGHHLKLAHSFAITCLISGINFLVIPRLATSLFGGL